MGDDVKGRRKEMRKEAIAVSQAENIGFYMEASGVISNIVFFHVFLKKKEQIC